MHVRRSCVFVLPSHADVPQFSNFNLLLLQVDDVAQFIMGCSELFFFFKKFLVIICSAILARNNPITSIAIGLAAAIAWL